MKQSEESFLSEIVDLDSIRKDKLNLIDTPCGSGKTTLALKVLPQKHCNPGLTLYLIDTLAGMAQLLKESECQCYDSEILDPNSYFYSNRPHKITVTTYAKFGVLCYHYPGWCDYLDTIICDEIHKLPEMMRWEKDSEIKYYEAAWNSVIDCAASAAKPTIIAMTATPLRLFQKVHAYPKMNKEKGHVEWYSPMINQVVINKSCETSISIKSHVDYMVVHTSESDTLFQAMGRYRGDLDFVYIYRPSEEDKIELPEEMLECPLFKEDLEFYIHSNNIRNFKGEFMKTPSFLQLLQKQGYEVTPGKVRGGKRYNKISLPT